MISYPSSDDSIPKLDGIPTNSYQFLSIPCNSYQFLSIPSNSVQFLPIPINSVQFRAIPTNSYQFRPISCNSYQFLSIPSNSVQVLPIPINSVQFRAIPTNSVQFRPIPCNSYQFLPIPSWLNSRNSVPELGRMTRSDRWAVIQDIVIPELDGIPRNSQEFRPIPTNSALTQFPEFRSGIESNEHEGEGGGKT
jgi:hypothetical protein